MIKVVTVENAAGEQLDIDLANPYKSGLAVHSIDGLGPPKAFINAVSKTTSDGSDFVSARADYRPVVLNFIFVPCPDIESSRLKTYRFFPVKGRIKLTIQTEHRKAYAEGYVESNEPDIFNKMTGCTISVVCPDSYMYDENEFEVTLETLSVIPEFEFPFSNESVTSKLIRFGTISSQPMAMFNYPGDSDVGCMIDIKANREGLKAIAVIDHNTGDMFAISAPTGPSMLVPYPLGSWEAVPFEPPLRTSSVITIDTRKGSKRVLLHDYANQVPQGCYANILNWADLRNSKWLRIHPGVNTWSFVYETEGDVDPEIEVTVTAPIAYQGV